MSAEEEDTSATRQYPIICNDEGAPVAFGSDYPRHPSLYCGRILGEEAIPGSDGACGPDNGPQCQSCSRMEVGHEKWDIMKLLFPTMPDEVLISVLRSFGGRLADAVEKLSEEVEQLTPVPYVGRSLALPGPKPEGLPDPVMPVEEGQVDGLLEVLNHIDRQTAEAVLRRNDNDVELSVAYLLDASEDTLTAHVVEDIQSAEAFSEAYEEFLIEREARIREVVEQTATIELSEPLIELRDKCTELILDEEEDQKRLADSRNDGHHMVQMEDGEEDSGVVCRCCANNIPGVFTGTRHCTNCHLCEGCIGSKVVFRCPVMANGGHLHHHPMTPCPPGLRTHHHCDVGKRGVEGCKDRIISWFCEDCDFDICTHCIRLEAPTGFSRRLGWVGFEEDDEEGEDVAIDQTGSNEVDFDANAAERTAAARWEGALQRETSTSEVIVGTGTIGTTAPPQGGAATRGNINMTTREAGQPTDGPLSPESMRALESFASSLDGGNQNDDNVAAACDVAHAEDLLHRAQMVGNKHISRSLQQAIAAGRFEIAGTLLLAPTYAPNTSSEDDEAMVCFCGEEINAETAPGGAVGCLRGHPMHAGCAADTLLGGGHCPTCRSPLFFPKVPSPEAKAAKEYAAAELERCQREEEEKIKQEAEELHGRGLEITFNVGDIVRISSEEVCREEIMKCPAQTGWSNDMATACGLLGRVAEVSIHDEATAVRVLTKDLGHVFGCGARQFTCRTCYNSYNNRSNRRSRRGVKCIHCHKCQSCCQRGSSSHSCVDSVHDWKWPKASLTLVCRATSAALWDASLADKDVAAAATAEQHIMRLRAELKAVSAARDVVKEEMNALMRPTLSVRLSRELSDGSSMAVMGAVDKVSPADWRRARHLLLLARQWGDSENAKAKRKSLYDAVRLGEIDTVARIVRRYNASHAAEQARWADALSEKGEYVVEQFARVDLLAWPADGAPKTGFSLDPKARFFSKSERLDNLGRLWIQVDESSFIDLSSFKGKVVSNLSDRNLLKALIGVQVIRGEDWDYRDQDGGEGEVGVIRSIESYERVTVRWRNGSIYTYRTGHEEKFDLQFAGLPPPPPQGWICSRPSGLGSPAVVRKGRSALRCFGCGDGLLPESPGKHKFSLVKSNDNIKEGDNLLVAATLEPVEVMSFEEGRVTCKFVSASDVPGKQALYSVWYRPEDLVHPQSKSKSANVSYDEDEMVLVNDHLRSRRELVLMCGNEAEARKLWSDAKSKGDVGSPAESEDSASCFASCARGHLLHSRCLQGALLAGQSCPAPGCSEPLWVPRVTSQEQDTTTCCGSNTDRRDEEAIQDAADLVGHEALAQAREQAGGAVQENITIAGVQELKMCPACLCGPLFNENCNDMKAHHGQCSTAAVGGTSCDFQASASDIATALMEITEEKTVANVLPKCPTHDVLVMFNGCMACGHLFTDTSWSAMPKWDPHARVNLALDKKKRQAATLLAEQIRKEAAYLQFERDALRNTWGGRGSLLGELPPLPPPAEEFAGCGPDCTSTSHSRDGPCLFCGQNWNQHTGHNCPNGQRGSWVTSTGSGQWEEEDYGDY